MTTAFAPQSKLLQFTSMTDERLSIQPVRDCGPSRASSIRSSLSS
jgi:hypothetical protein